ncbi:hypothetical protein [Lactiplantibacillus herbarum]|nr:hypothetical protein [Lactiplantibacillus herbarum]
MRRKLSGMMLLVTIFGTLLRLVSAWLRIKYQAPKKMKIKVKLK